MGLCCLETAFGLAPGERLARLGGAVLTGHSRAKAMAGHQKEKAISDEVHQNQILRELYLKELRTQKLYTQYHVNPLRKGEGRYQTEGGKEGRSRQVCGAGGAGWSPVRDTSSDLAPILNISEL